MIAAFIVPYGPEAKSISRPDTLEMVTIDPPSAFKRYGNAASTRPTVPIRSTAKLVRQFSALSGIASSDVRHDAVDTTERLCAGVHPIGQRRGVPYVDRGADRGGAVGGQRRLRRKDGIGATGAVGDRGALSKQPLDGRASDPAGAARDKKSLASQSQIHGPPRLPCVDSVCNCSQ